MSRPSPSTRRRPCFRAAATGLLWPLATLAANPPDPFTLNQTSTASFSSAMYGAGPIQDAKDVLTLAGWDAVGRQLQTRVDLVPGPPGGFRFDQDLASAWTDMTQTAAGADAKVRSYAQLGGYYLNSSGNVARSEVHQHETVIVTNSGAPVVFNLVQTTHGTLLAGGFVNAVTASAQETTIVIGHGNNFCLELGLINQNAFRGFAENWEGFASVSASQSTPTITVNGTWAGKDQPFHGSVVGYPMEFQGIEITALQSTRTIELLDNARLELDIDYVSTVQAVTGPGSGFLSYGEADFSGTGLVNFRAVDELTGLPATGVTVTLVSSPVPELPSAGLLLLGLAGMAAVHRGMRARTRALRRGLGMGLLAFLPVAAMAQYHDVSIGWSGCPGGSFYDTVSFAGDGSGVQQCTVYWYGKADPGNRSIIQVQTSAAADLGDGTVRTYASFYDGGAAQPPAGTSVPVSASAQAAYTDTVRFAVGASYIGLPAPQAVLRLVVSGRFSGLPGHYDSDTLFSVDAINGPFFRQTTEVHFVWNGHGPAAETAGYFHPVPPSLDPARLIAVVQLTLPLAQGAQYSLGVSQFTEVDANLTTGALAEADFSHTSRLSLELPAGWSFSSDSGVLLLSAVPEPPPAAALAGGVACLAWLRRRRARHGTA